MQRSVLTAFPLTLPSPGGRGVSFFGGQRNLIAMIERVLMIEDDQGLAAMVGEYLAPLGIHITTCPTAGEGLRLLAKDSFDALILDVMLPDLDGFEVCRRVRARAMTCRF